MIDTKKLQKAVNKPAVKTKEKKGMDSKGYEKAIPKGLGTKKNKKGK